MIKIYFLKQLKNGDYEYTEGSEYISQAIIQTTEDPSVRRVIIEENNNLATLALQTENPTQQDIDNYNRLISTPPQRNLIKELDDLKTILKSKGIL